MLFLVDVSTSAERCCIYSLTETQTFLVNYCSTKLVCSSPSRRSRHYAHVVSTSSRRAVACDLTILHKRPTVIFSYTQFPDCHHTVHIALHFARTILTASLEDLSLFYQRQTTGVMAVLPNQECQIAEYRLSRSVFCFAHHKGSWDLFMRGRRLTIQTHASRKPGSVAYTTIRLLVGSHL